MLLHRRWPRLAAWAHAAAPRPRPQQHAIPTSVRPASTSAAPPATPLPPRRRARWLLFLPPAAAAYLCTWQIERKAWKEGLMQRWEAAAAAEPVALASLPACAPELTRVVAAGLLDHGRAVLVGPRPRSVAGGTVSGSLLVTPLLDPTTRRPTALVVRGWVPAAWRDDSGLRSSGEPRGVVSLACVVRASEAPSMFVPLNVPAKGEWHWLDADALAAAAGAPPGTPLLEAVAPDAGPPPPPRAGAPAPMDVLGGRTQRLSASPAPAYPAPRSLQDMATVKVSPADHRNYAFTWGALALVTAGLAVRVARG